MKLLSNRSIAEMEESVNSYFECIEISPALESVQRAIDAEMLLAEHLAKALQMISLHDPFSVN